MKRMRALVVGVDGLIGGALARALAGDGWTVASTSRRPSAHRPPGIVPFDLADEQASTAAGLSVLPGCDVAFICAAMTSFADCRASPDRARRVNAEAPAALAAHVVARGGRVIHLSTAAVLDCLEPRMRADRPLAGQSLYGRWKGQAEEAVLALGPQVTVLRLAKVLTADAPLLRRWIVALRAGETVEAFDDHRIAPVAVSHAVAALTGLAERGEGGIYQLSGSRDVSYAEVASDLADVFDLPPTRVARCSAIDRGIAPEDRTPYTSLDCDRLTALTGIVPPEPFPLVRGLCLD